MINQAQGDCSLSHNGPLPKSTIATVVTPTLKAWGEGGGVGDKIISVQ